MKPSFPAAMKYGIPVVVTGNGIYDKIIESSMRGLQQNISVFCHSLFVICYSDRDRVKLGNKNEWKFQAEIFPRAY